MLKVLSCLGFHPTWINWIKVCISTVSFSVIINGEPYGHFHPSRGLRQEDSLSPFLLIIGNEVLSGLILREENLENLKSIKITRDGPFLTHLLFANDLILFGSASVRNANSFLKCLDNYSSWYALKTILFGMVKGKSFIQFSKNSSPSTIRDVREVLMNFKLSSSRIKYLGLHLNFDRSNNNFFLKKLRTKFRKS